MKKVILAVILVLCFATLVFAYDFTISINNNKAIWARDMLCIHFNYDENCLKDANSNCIESQKQFIERNIRQEIKGWIRSVYVPGQVSTTESAANAYIDGVQLEPQE